MYKPDIFNFVSKVPSAEEVKAEQLKNEKIGKYAQEINNANNYFAEEYVRIMEKAIYHGIDDLRKNFSEKNFSKQILDNYKIHEGDRITYNYKYNEEIPKWSVLNFIFVSDVYEVIKSHSIAIRDVHNGVSNVYDEMTKTWIKTPNDMFNSLFKKLQIEMLKRGYYLIDSSTDTELSIKISLNNPDNVSDNISDNT
jgi:hypothetical protein